MREAQRVSEIVKNYRPIDYRNTKREDSIDYSSIDMVKIEKDNSAPSQYHQRAIAEKLLRELGEPKSWKFYLKCAYHLSEDQIWSFVEMANRPNINKHNNYFVRLALREMNK